MELAQEPDAPVLMEDDIVMPREVRGQDDMSDPEDNQCSAVCTHMATSDDDEEQFASRRSHMYIRTITGHPHAHT